MSTYRWTDLATYNAERRRGIVHTPEFVARMAEEQEAFDAEQRSERLAAGCIEVEGGWLCPPEKIANPARIDITLWPQTGGVRVHEHAETDGSDEPKEWRG